MGSLLAIPLSSSAQKAKLSIDPKAEQLFRQMTDYLKSAQSFSFEAEITRDEILPSGQKLQIGATSDYVVRRPNRLQANYNGDRRQVSFYYDGTNFTMSDTDKNLYGTVKVAPDIDSLVDQIQDNYGFSLPMGDLMSTNIYTTVSQKASSSRYIGLSKIRGVTCHHLAFTLEHRDLQIWIADSQPPVPCKFIITYKEEPGSPQYTAILYNWDFKERSPDDPRFTFQPPANAQQIEIFPQNIRQVNSNANSSGDTP
jgi:hypothetical protein